MWYCWWHSGSWRRDCYYVVAARNVILLTPEGMSRGKVYLGAGVRHDSERIRGLVEMREVGDRGEAAAVLANEQLDAALVAERGEG